MEPEPWPGATDDLPFGMKLKFVWGEGCWRSTYRWWAWPLKPIIIAVCDWRLRQESRRLDRIENERAEGTGGDRDG